MFVKLHKVCQINCASNQQDQVRKGTSTSKFFGTKKYYSKLMIFCLINKIL